MRKKGAMRNGAEGDSADFGMECLTQPNPNAVWSLVTPPQRPSVLKGNPTPDHIWDRLG